MNPITRKSLLWSFVGRFATQIINLGVFVILARILGPKTVGDAVFPIFIVGFSIICLQAIIGQTIISKNFINKPELEVVLYVSRRLPIALVFALSIPIWFMLKAVKTENFFAVFVVILLTIIFSQSHFYISIFEVRGEFKKIAKVESISMLMSGFCAVLISILGLKSLSLIFQIMILQGSLFYFSKKYSSDYFSEKKDKIILKKIYSFGFPAAGSSVATFFSRNIDNLIVLKFIGKTEAGIYSRIYTLTMFPVTQLSYIISRVYFPKLSILRNNQKEYQRVFFRGFYLISLIILTFSSLLALYSESIIRITLGVEWLDGSTILKMLAFSAMCQPVGATLSWLALSNENSSFLFKWNLFTTFFTLTIMIIFSKNGLDSLVLGYLISNLILFIPSILGMSYFLKMQPTQIFFIVLRPYFFFSLFWFCLKYVFSSLNISIVSIFAFFVMSYFIYVLTEYFRNRNIEKIEKNVIFLSFSKEIWGAERSLLELGQGLSLTQNPNEFHLVCLNSDLSEAWTSLGPSFISTYFESKFRAIFFLLSNIFKQNFFSIIFFSLDGLILTPVIRIMKPFLKQVLDFHDFLPRRQGRLKLKFLSCFLNKIIAVSDFCLHELQGTHGAKTKLYRPIQIRSTIDHTISQKRTRVGIIGRIDVDKNLNRAIEVLELLPKEFSLIFRGSSFSDKSYQLVLENRVEKLKERVQFQGKIELSALYEDIDILLVTNTNEPMGRTIGECQLLKIPVVVPNLGGASELVRDLETGFVYNPKNLDSMSSAILKASSALPIILNRAREEALIRHNPKEYAKNYREVITSR